MDKKIVVARLTAVRSVGVRTIIEIYSDASFHSFYNYFTQDGRRHSTKKLVRVANRNAGLQPWFRAYRMQPGLEVIAEQLNHAAQFEKVTIRILKKRAYRQLLEAAPDVLGATVRVIRSPDPRLLPTPVLRYPVHIPESYTPIKKRMDIILGRD